MDVALQRTITMTIGLSLMALSLLWLSAYAASLSQSTSTGCIGDFVDPDYNFSFPSCSTLTGDFATHINEVTSC